MPRVWSQQFLYVVFHMPTNIHRPFGDETLDDKLRSGRAGLGYSSVTALFERVWSPTLGPLQCRQQPGDRPTGGAADDDQKKNAALLEKQDLEGRNVP